MSDLLVAGIAVLFCLVAFVYSSIGHAGASGYIAVLLFFAATPEVIRPTALVLNIIVACIGLVQFYKAGMVDFKKILPFVISSAPVAFFAAQINFPKEIFYKGIGFTLLVSAITVLWSVRAKVEGELRPISNPVALISGAFIGFLSGMTGTGGAIFLTPLLILNRWSTAKQASGMAVVFVLINSSVALAGIFGKGLSLAPAIPVWIAAACLGAFAGTYYGILKFSVKTTKVFIFLVLISASLKMLLH
jgi:uncharacterized membrane protein YfcA